MPRPAQLGSCTSVCDARQGAVVRVQFEIRAHFDFGTPKLNLGPVIRCATQHWCTMHTINKWSTSFGWLAGEPIHMLGTALLRASHDQQLIPTVHSIAALNQSPTRSSRWLEVHVTGSFITCATVWVLSWVTTSCDQPPVCVTKIRPGNCTAGCSMYMPADIGILS